MRPDRPEANLGRLLAMAELRLAPALASDGWPAWPRLYATPSLHRILPDRPALGLAAMAGRAAWRLRPELRRRARAHLAEIVGDDGRLERLAREHVIERAVRGELLWRPWMWDRLPLLGLEHLEAARQHGGGVLVASPHMGFAFGIAYGLLARGVRLTVLGGEWMSTASTGLLAYRARSRLQEIERRGGRMIRQGGAFPVLRALLEQGEVCHVFADIPGSGRATFLGRRARLATGVPRLSLLTDSPVVLAVADTRGRLPLIRLRPPLWPRDFSTPEQILERLAADMSEEIAARPELLAEPLAPRVHLGDYFEEAPSDASP
jgi:lauroyl/myristoyl acyltransferase